MPAEGVRSPVEVEAAGQEIAHEAEPLLDVEPGPGELQPERARPLVEVGRVAIEPPDDRTRQAVVHRDDEDEEAARGKVRKNLVERRAGISGSKPTAGLRMIGSAFPVLPKP